jgi:hypothetical protein
VKGWRVLLDTAEAAGGAAVPGPGVRTATRVLTAGSVVLLEGMPAATASG